MNLPVIVQITTGFCVDCNARIYMGADGVTRQSCRCGKRSSDLPVVDSLDVATEIELASAQGLEEPPL